MTLNSPTNHTSLCKNIQLKTFAYAYGKFSKIVTSWTENILYIKSRINIRETNEAFASGLPFWKTPWGHYFAFCSKAY